MTQPHAPTPLPAKHPLRHARWIWPPETERPHNTFADFRRDFSLARVPRRAVLYLTVDQCYVLYVNGQYVSRGPARGYASHWPFDEIDIAAHLQPGTNWIAVRAYNAGSSTFGYLHEGVAGLLCAGRIGGVDLASGPGWIGRLNPAQRRYTARMSMQINLQEHFDARLDDERWISSQRPPRGWSAFGGGKHFGSMPWHTCEPRMIPHLTDDIHPYARTCTQASGRCADGGEQAENLTDVFRVENTAARWRAAPPAKVGRNGLTLAGQAVRRGRYHATVCDLGQAGVGTVILQVTGGLGGEIVDLFACEAIDDDGRPILAKQGAACWASMSMRLVLRKGKTRHEFMHMIGHRYLVVIVRGPAEGLKIEAALRQTRYPLDVRGRFTCDDPTLQQVYDDCVNTQRNCMLDAYVDTPWREQAQWWGDARVQALNTFHLADDARLLRRGIRSISGQRVPNGLTYGHAPTMSHHCVLPDFTLTWLLTLWDDYWQTGSVELFREQWPGVEAALGYFEGEGRGHNGLLRYDPRYWLFLDWAQLHKAGTPTLLNLWYALALAKLGELCAVAGMKAQARRLSACRAALEKRMVAKLFDRRVGMFRDGLTEAGKPVNVHSVHNQTLAIEAGLGPANAIPVMIEKRLLPLVRDEQIPGARPSSYWITYVYDVLERHGYGREVAEHIRRWWSPMLRYGGACETWVGGPLQKTGATIGGVGNISCSHAWAAHPIFHLVRTVGGIRQSDVAWGRIHFAPALDVAEIKQGGAVVPTPHGRIESRWRTEQKTIEVELSLPRSVVAEVDIAGMSERVSGGTHRWSIVR